MTLVAAALAITSLITQLNLMISANLILYTGCDSFIIHLLHMYATRNHFDLNSIIYKDAKVVKIYLYLIEFSGDGLLRCPLKLITFIAKDI